MALVQNMNGCYLMPGAEFYVAVDNKGLWPNLLLLPNGDIAATFYNHPSHGFGCGNIELWASQDHGKTWAFRSVVSDHADDPELTRMNCAVGLDVEGNMIALISGWSKGRTRPILPVQVCVSSDHGHAWRRQLIEDTTIPYGKIIRAGDHHLVCTMYHSAHHSSETKQLIGELYASTDHGLTWRKTSTISDSAGEVAIIGLSDGEYLAAGRTPNESWEEGGYLQLYRSTGHGTAWQKGIAISLPMQHPAHFLRLHNADILMSYGSRIHGIFGVMLKISKDEGKTWSNPCSLITIPKKSDCGYPSSVQLKDGTIVTAYYFGPKLTPVQCPHGLPWHGSYHMGIARWNMSCWCEN